MQQITMDMGDNNAEYQAFVDKFKPKKTTDDCYTPPLVYDAVKDWVFKHYDLPADTVVICPFYPGGDYERADYPDGCVVIDNPPFSIMVQIEKFYIKRGINFFLFAPGLSIFKDMQGLKYICVGATLTYDNGAKVNTSFVTNMGEFLIESAPDLNKALEDANKKTQAEMVRHVPNYKYPDNVVTAARANYFSQHGTYYRFRGDNVSFTRALDAQREEGKTIFGAGFLLADLAAADLAAADLAAAERAAARVWKLSDRERGIIDKLNVGE